MITNLRLQKFRSYNEASFEFGPGVNVIVGPNGSGKTNLLEAILVLARGKSYRARDADLVQQDQPWSRLDGQFDDSQRTVKLEQLGDVIKKTFLVDHKPLQRLMGNKIVPTVLFEPNHLLMLSGPPDGRRQFIDDLLEQTVIGYPTLLRHYKRSLSQRNALLKNPGQQVEQQLFAWDVRLSELGAQIVLERQRLANQINQQLATVYADLAGQKASLRVNYSNATEPGHYASSMLKKLEKTRLLDLQRGFTGTGPHREDLLFYLNDQPLAVTASRGEVRTALLALKVIELQLLEVARAQKPILLLDDVFSELDITRRQALTTFLQNHQTFITTTNADTITERYSVKFKTIELAGAKVQ